MNKTFTTSPTQEQLKPNELEKHLAETLILAAQIGPAPKPRDEVEVIQGEPFTLTEDEQRVLSHVWEVCNSKRDYLFTDKPYH